MEIYAIKKEHILYHRYLFSIKTPKIREWQVHSIIAFFPTSVGKSYSDNPQGARVSNLLWGLFCVSMK
jgi:hypothetical protein